MDARGKLMYILAWTNENESPLVTCSVSEVTQPVSPGLNLRAYSPISQIAKLKLSTNEKIDWVEIGVAMNPRVSGEKPVVAVKSSDQSPWLYHPLQPDTKEYCTEEERRADLRWTTVRHVPAYLTALTVLPARRVTTAHDLSFSIARKCPDCEFTTFSAQWYRDHCALHSTVTHFTCRHPACGCQFLERYKLVRHMQEKHDYPIVCHWCGMSVRSAHALSSHVACHAVKQYECEACGQRFYTPQQRDGHRYISHLAWRDAWKPAAK
ncbi:hypothetical protein ACOMHN_033225 [Nucella lapillus]